jgi:AcrR family transcriptional regulator
MAKARQAETRGKDRAATETAILEAARRVLAARGFAALTVSAVAEEAGIDRKLIYRYFGGLEGLAEQLGRDRAWLAGAQPMKSRAEALGAYTEALRADPALQQMLAWELVETSPVLRELDAARSKAMRKLFSGLNDGARADADAAAENAVALAAVHYLSLRERTLGGFAGLKLDREGWRRVEAVLAKLVSP